jgi:two-component system cell cycle sensor histidine kinase/response regulator CckA
MSSAGHGTLKTANARVPSPMHLGPPFAREFRLVEALRTANGRLAGSVAHDFNNLLTVILGNCDLLLTALGPHDPHRAQVAEILRAGTSAAGLTRQLLAFSRKEIVQPALLDLNVVVADMRAMLGRLIPEGVKIVLRLGPAPATVRADRARVEQVVLNLAVNARDAMPEGGTLTITTGHVGLDAITGTKHLALTPGPYVVLTVADTGTGMKPEVAARLFEPFFTTKAPGKGTGLGLAIVQGIAADAGGSVGVSTSIGTGTSFKVYFPKAGAEAPVEASRRGKGESGRPC